MDMTLKYKFINDNDIAGKLFVAKEEDELLIYPQLPTKHTKQYQGGDAVNFINFYRSGGQVNPGNIVLLTGRVLLFKSGKTVIKHKECEVLFNDFVGWVSFYSISPLLPTSSSS